ncbi:MAG: site-specific DNA-methyltransferase [Ignavibacteriales bacterium]|nr:MAG: site-specific DNA-methyltransferase [Ignavibacteriales bacterium]
MIKKRAPLNRTLSLSEEDKNPDSSCLIKISSHSAVNDIKNKLINQDLFKIVEFLPDNFVDLMFIDPPYNLTKAYNNLKFRQMRNPEYEEWIDSWLSKTIRLLKPDASVYICCDWRSSSAVFRTAGKYLNINNRITWEREKGRGARSNWKNCLEDIWFCSVSDKYTFNIDAVKIHRRVIAPYKNENGEPKDWILHNDEKVRITHPSNLWTDITVPFWSMPENTDHPTQKPEKLLAKIILASSNPGDIVFDPFAGSGTTLVTAKKLDRNFCGIEIDEIYAALAVKRLLLAEKDKNIQGYEDGVFRERNSAKYK